MIRQLFRFAIVGVIAALTDVGVLVLLKELFHVDVLLSSAVSFSVSVVVNYILSMAFVFKSKGQNKIRIYRFCNSQHWRAVLESDYFMGRGSFHVHTLPVNKIPCYGNCPCL